MPRPLRDAQGRINPDADLLLDPSTLAVLHARDGDWKPLIGELRGIAARLRTGAPIPTDLSDKLDCAADLLEAAQQPPNQGKPPALSTWWRDLLITKSFTAWSQTPGTWKKSLLNKTLAERFNVTRGYVRKIFRRGVPEGWRERD